MPDPLSPASTFAALGLSEPLLRATSELGYVAPTEVQIAVVPAVLAGRDVWASAETGSGKTASFALPILEALAAAPRRKPRLVRALILAPTRELAAQIGAAFHAYGARLELPPEVRIVFGGVSINPQMMDLRGGADIVVATPGRLLDLVDKNAVSLASVATLVLDEADRLFDRGFEDELGRILELLPRSRQTLLFSATFPPAVRALAASVLRDPLRIDVTPAALEVPAIVQRAIEVDRPRRTHLLRHLVREAMALDPASRALVFVATTYSTEHVAEKLRGLGIDAAALHGKLSQGARTRVLSQLRDGTLRVLVATDVAARGLDITGLPLVVSYDLPRSPADHLHRIGRTGRAGATGVAISFVTAETRAHFELIERRHRIDVPRERIAGFEPTERAEAPAETPAEAALAAARATGGVKGKRKSKKDKLREAAARAAETPKPAGNPER